MPEKTPPAYQWSVSLAAAPGPGFLVEAAYPVLADDGFMLLKDSDHKIVFAAAPGTGCTFMRCAATGQGDADHWTAEPATGGRYRMIHDATGQSSEGGTEYEAFGGLVSKLIRAGDIVITPGRPAGSGAAVSA